MNRRDFFASLTAAPVVMLSVKPEPKRPELRLVGIAGHDIAKGEAIYAKSDNQWRGWPLLRQATLSDVR